MRTGFKVALLFVSVLCFSAGFVGTSAPALSDTCPTCNCGYQCGDDVFTLGVLSGGTCQLALCKKTAGGTCHTYSCE